MLFITLNEENAAICKAPAFLFSMLKFLFPNLFQLHCL
jgi:hypothetical protein